jgi:hypothetical protein
MTRDVLIVLPWRGADHGSHTLASRSSSGMPLTCKLKAARNMQVCAAATKRDIFSDKGIARQATDQQYLLDELTAFVQTYAVGASGASTLTLNVNAVQEPTVVLPTQNLLFDGHALMNLGGMPQHVQGYSVHSNMM